MPPPDPIARSDSRTSVLATRQPGFDPPRADVLTHSDYWSGNVVWRDGALTGIVDWSGAVRGPRGYDVGWCRFDLYLLFGEPIADVFLTA